MDYQSFLSALTLALTRYFPEEVDPSLKPIDSSGCITCRNMTFDYIIVGAGAAGCVLANRLSANPVINVLLIEAGGPEDYITDTPAIHLNLNYNTKYDWNYTTVPQRNACGGGGCYYPRGLVMGGSTSTNAMMYVRGSAQDYNDWANFGNVGWNYSDLFQYFLMLENMTIPELMNSTYHSTKGPFSVGRGRYFPNIIHDYFQAGREIGLYENDYNGATQIGISYSQLNIRGSVRCSTSKAYLDPIRNRPNLFIFMNTMVTRLLYGPNNNRVIGVRCETNGEVYDVLARSEVLLSAGALNTPKLLMLSGIGPRQHLESAGIPLVRDLPVGENLKDHCLILVLFSMDGNSTESCCDTLISERTILEYAMNRTGPITSNLAPLVSFINRNNNSINHPAEVQYHISFMEMSRSSNSGQFAAIFNYNILQPRSVGWVRLNTTNPQGAPLINPNYNDDPYDMNLAIWGLRQLFNFMETNTLRRYNPRFRYDFTPSCDLYRNNATTNFTDEYLACYIRYMTGTFYHPVSTARMGPASDRSTVVDSNLKVHGIDGIRIVDASIMPTITRGNTMVPTIVIGERAARIILNELNF